MKWLSDIWKGGFRDNRGVFNHRLVVEDYAPRLDLQKPEASILEILRPKLSGMRMLDLGVGAGRTTRHFAPLVREYLGVDYAEAMVDYCRRQFSQFPGNPTFLTHDALRLSQLNSGRFDFILFSYNGLDFSNHPERLEILAAIRTLLNPGGTFCFSTHNLYALTRHWNLGACLNGPKALKQTAARILFSCLYGNPQKLEKSDHHVLRDGAEAFRIRNYCIKPEAQLRQLYEAGFRDFQIFSLEKGEAMAEARDWKTVPDRWLYFLCRT